MQFLVVLLAFGCALASANGNDQELDHSPDNIITNGFDAYEGEAPYIVSLSLRKNDSNEATLCGGSIIAHTWILTAAQCLVEHDYVDIHYGSIWKWNGQISHRVLSEDFIVHQNWSKTNGNDIALIRTPFVNFSDRINKVKLPTYFQRNQKFDKWWTVNCGWGRQNSGHFADWLQCVDNRVMGNAECSRTYRQLPNEILCVRSKDRGSPCDGDFGGPLVTHQNQILIGITSFISPGGCASGHPAAFTRVTAHLRWIREHSGVIYYI